METATAPSIPVQATNAESAPALRLTPGAIAQVKQVIAQQGFDGYFFSVRVVPAGCSGMGYDLNMVKELKEGDVTFEQDGVKIATDALSLQYLSNTEVDYVVNVSGAGFKFNNPNAKSTCGCGTSFSA